MVQPTKQKGLLIVISGPAGVGKGTIINRLLEKCPEIHLSVSETTRAPRDKEKHGRDYFFVSDEVFKTGIKEGRYLEYDYHFEHAYATPAAYVQKQLDAGFDIILEIEFKGARQIREKSEDAVSIFILPPSSEILKDRLSGRGTENEKQMMLRQTRALEELKSVSEYDYVVINDDLETAVNDVRAIIRAEKSKTKNMKQKTEAIIGGFNEL